MARKTLGIRIIGVHPVKCSKKEFDEAVEYMWGEDLDADELDEARARTREHFDTLRLIVIEVTPVDAAIDWSKITQKIPGVSRRNWQAPYDEELVDPVQGRWAFFLHAVDFSTALSTPVGEILLPAETTMPGKLKHKKYESPG